MKAMRFIRCKGKNDILVVSPRAYNQIGESGLEISCGHAHSVIQGPAKFVRRRA